MDAIPDSTLAAGVSGLNLSGGTLGEQLAGEYNLLVFLRHFG